MHREHSLDCILLDLSDHYVVLDSVALQELSEWVHKDQRAEYPFRSSVENPDVSLTRLPFLVHSPPPEEHGIATACFLESALVSARLI